MRAPEIFHRVSDLDKASRRGIDKKEKVFPNKRCLRRIVFRCISCGWLPPFPTQNPICIQHPLPPSFPSGIAAVPASRSIFAASGSERCYKCSRPLPLPPMIQKKKPHTAYSMCWAVMQMSCDFPSHSLGHTSFEKAEGADVRTAFFRRPIRRSAVSTVMQIFHNYLAYFAGNSSPFLQ